MNKEHHLKVAYNELNEKYIQLYSEKQETDYRLLELIEEHEQYSREEDEIRKLHQNVRLLKHDMKNHLMVIASYLNDEDYDSAKKYTSEMLGRLNEINSYIETGNSLLNHIINDKLNYARSKQIVIKAEIDNLHFDALQSIDFSALLTNLLDNGIEASLREDLSNREMWVNIVKCRGYETICIKNKISASVLDNNPELKSGKEHQENHGLGLAKVRSIVKKCNGLYDIYEENGFFCVKVFIPE